MNEEREKSDLPVIQRHNPKEMTEEFIMKIPECCREGHPDCPHVVGREEETPKRNIGL
jgi:hypothetical protein